MSWTLQPFGKVSSSQKNHSDSVGLSGCDPHGVSDSYADSSAVIQALNLGKSYRLWMNPQDRLKQPIRSMLSRWLPLEDRPYFREFWALRDVTLQVNRGETVGVVGRNGSGKSTLLQLLCGTISPTEGSCHTSGRIAALLELGSGFNPEFTGHDNVYMNASILGLSENEIRELYTSILEFADIGDFIHQPVKTYSSGMYVRLAFAVAVSVQPDVLLVDEALAVGDVKFQAKCFRKFEEIVDRGTTILFVTHSVEDITRRCSRAILLDRGNILATGHPGDVVNLYMELMFGTPDSPQNLVNAGGRRSSNVPGILTDLDGRGFEDRAGYNRHEFRWGNREAEILDFMIYSDGSGHKNVIRSGIKIFLALTVVFHKSFSFPIYGLTIKTPDGVIVYGSNSRDFRGGPLKKPVEAGEMTKVVMVLNQNLGSGDYMMSVGVAVDILGEIIPLDRRYDSIHIVVENPGCQSVGLADFGMAVELFQ